MFAALEIGAAVVPVSWQLKPYELKGILKACEPKALFYGSDFEDTMKEVLPEISSLHTTIVTGTASETTSEFEDLLQVQAICQKQKRYLKMIRHCLCSLQEPLATQKMYADARRNLQLCN